MYLNYSNFIAKKQQNLTQICNRYYCKNIVSSLNTKSKNNFYLSKSIVIDLYSNVIHLKKLGVTKTMKICLTRYEK